MVGLNLAMQHLQVSETHPRFGKMWPGIKTLAKESGVGQSTARRSLHRLIALKFLGAQQGHGGRRQGKEGYDVSLYWLLDPSGVVRALPADRAYPVR